MTVIVYGISLLLLLVAIWMTIVHLRVQRRSRELDRPRDDNG
jgi:hypothetical protein